MSRREGFSHRNLSSLHSGHKTRKENVALGWSSTRLSNLDSASPEKDNEPAVPRLASSSMDLNLSINDIITARNLHMKIPTRRRVGLYSPLFSCSHNIHTPFLLFAVQHLLSTLFLSKVS